MAVLLCRWSIYSLYKNKLRCTSGELCSNKAFLLRLSYLPLWLFLICVVYQNPQRIKIFYAKIVYPLFSSKCFESILSEEKGFSFFK